MNIPLVLDGSPGAANIPVYLSASELVYVREVLRWCAGLPGPLMHVGAPHVVAEGLTEVQSYEVSCEALLGIADKLDAAMDRPPH